MNEPRRGFSLARRADPRCRALPIDQLLGGHFQHRCELADGIEPRRLPSVLESGDRRDRHATGRAHCLVCEQRPVTLARHPSPPLLQLS